MLDLSFLQNINVTSKGCVNDRSFYRIYRSFQDAVAGKNENVIKLDGEWDFRYFEKIGDAIDFPSIEFDKKVTVPHSAQLDGYDRPIYCGGGYVMPYYSPYVPHDNPVFCYSKKVKIETDKRVFITFDGVDSCLYLYVDRRFVGFASISHAQNEFEITDFIGQGENEIRVLVAKFNAGSYLEDQDKWRLSGIFRSVRLTFRPKKHLVDFTIQTVISKSEMGFDGEASFVFDNPSGVPIEVFFDGKTFVSDGKKLSIKAENVSLWSAENPALYDFIIHAGEEYIPEKIGFRSVKVENGVVKVNGAPVKLRGVNRHEFHPGKGAAISVEDTLNDLKMLKELNVNAVRTSHYPDMPEFYEMCDKYGFYVIDEADLECHGAAHQNGVNTYEERLFSDLAENPAWENEFLCRIKKLYSRDKNRCCVLFWSLGNESGYGKNFEKCAEWLKNRHDGRLIHYEGVFHRPGEDIYYTDKLDVMSRMYPELEWMTDNYLNDEREKRPLVLCEYSHAMGNSNGDVMDYWDIIESNDRFVGAFVWEFADHAINFMNDGKLRYGGDFGEKKHTGKFCIDGMLTAYRGVKSGAKEIAHVYSPLQIERAGENEFVVFNKNYFVSAEKVGLKYYIRNDGKTVCEGLLDVNDLAPRERKKIIIDTQKAGGNYSIVLFEAFHSESYGLNRAGSVFYQKAFTLLSRKETNDVVPAKCFDVCENGAKIEVNADDNLFVFDKDTGMLEQVRITGGKNLLKAPVSVNVARARLDNDCTVFSNWESAGIYNNQMYSVGYECKKERDCVTVAFNGALVTESTKPHIKYTLTYRITGKTVCARIKANISDFVKYLPRFGVTFALDKAFRTAEYLGYNEESYIDKHNYCYKTVASFDVDEDFSDYLVPQECGSRFDAEWVCIKNDDSEVVRIDSDKSFSFSVLPYGTMRLNDAAHNWQLGESESNYVCIDYAMSGVGSNSCGPELGEKYRLNDKEIDFRFTVSFGKE